MAIPEAAAERPGDRRFIRRWMGTALVLLVLPYLALLLLRPAGTTYSGMLFVPSDTFFYLSQMLHSQLGSWTFTDYFTWRQEPPLAILALYTALGKLALGGGVVSLGLVFHGARLGFSLLFMWQAWRLYGEAFPGTASRRVAVLFLLFTAGAGVFALLLPLPLRLQEPPFDLTFIESSSVYGMLATPHFAAVLFLLAVLLRTLLRIGSDRGSGWAATAVGALAVAALSLIHPEKVGVIALTGGLFLLWGVATRRWIPTSSGRRLFQLGLVVAAGVPYVAYAYLLTLNDVQVAELLRQGRTHQIVGDAVPYYMLGYGIPLLCALAGLPRLLRRPSRASAGEVLFWAFVAAELLVLVAPWRALDHRAEGLQMGLAGLAGRNLVHTVLPRLWRTRVFAAAVRRRLFGYRRKRLRLLSLNLVIILSAPTVLALAVASPRAGLADTAELYLTAGDSAAITWLRQNARPTDVVVTSPQSAQFVAAYGGTHVVCCEWAFTPNYDREFQALSDFFYLRIDTLTYLRSRHVRYLYFSSREAPYSPLNPRRMSMFREVFSSGDATLFEVAPAP